MNFAIVLSGGTGSRLPGLGVPKQYYKAGQKPVIAYSLETLAEIGMFQKLVIVAQEEWQSFLLPYLEEGKGRFVFACPGENRQLSIYHGLLSLKDDASEDDIVLIHDGARPMTSKALFKSCIREAECADGAMPVLPMKDTVYYSKDGKAVTSLLERECIFAGQAPEAFRYGKYLRAVEALLPEEILLIHGSSEPALKAGMNIRLVEGEEANFKITTASDLERFCRYLEGREGQG
mgnify:CR=1 FL=1